ncbi:SufS family cysteine desulfurase [Candidatus Haliotispira prima]|uniref:Cysteine desulfurase n=1 Tax=Candidatus Haliotispira prima TaxID=3034016 RepID=A0ABY8MGY1_9SPIO|nr:SufS family cysteine desulfurase [Candidatus Haliotispira prima]
MLNNEKISAKTTQQTVRQTIQWASEQRDQFPIFSRHPEWSYLDSAATAQKPRRVIDFLQEFWCERNAPLHRGVYRLSAQVTQDYEDVREKVARFIHAGCGNEIVFCRGTTDAINLVAHSFVAPRLKKGDNILISAMEHHANFLPWQQLCQKTGAELRIIPLRKGLVEGAFRQHLQVGLDLESAEALLDDRTQFMALNHVSNVLGVINPVTDLCQLAKTKNIPVLLDGAQAIVHGSVDVKALGCDFYVFSGHKLYGPDGVGVLYGRSELLETMPPYQTGGDMIEFVSTAETTFAPPPQRFEAGTMPVSAVIGLGVAIDYFQSLPEERLLRHENTLLQLATENLRSTKSLQKVQIIGDETDLTRKVGVLSFVIEGVHPHDIGSILDSANVAVRAGHHCAQPLMADLKLTATARASFAVYNNERDVQQFCEGIEKVITMMI